MSKQDQINQLASDICSFFSSKSMSKALASLLYDKGYRKDSEVEREIFECLLKDITHGLEIARSTRKKFLHNIEKNNIWVYYYDGEIKALEGMECLIAELKKKYER